MKVFKTTNLSQLEQTPKYQAYFIDLMMVSNNGNSGHSATNASCISVCLSNENNCMDFITSKLLFKSARD